MDLPAVSDTPPGPPPGAVPHEIHGLADSAGADRIFGWALDSSRPGHRLRLELRLGSEVIGTGVANQLRADLQSNGIGDGQHGFEIEVTPDQLQRVQEFRLLGFAADGSKVRVPIRMRRPPPKPAAPAVPAVAPEEVAQLRAELVAHANWMRELPEPKALRDLVAQHNDLAAFVRGFAAQVDQRIAALPTSEQLAALASAQQELTDHHASLAERCTALEGWMVRLEQRVNDLPAGNSMEATAPSQKMDFWLKLLFSLLGGSLLLAVLVGMVMLRSR
jgi:hypothetical protein